MYIENLAIHIVGNSNDDIVITKKPITVSQDLNSLLCTYFYNSIVRNEAYSFFHENDIKYNEVYNIIADIFDTPNSLYDNSVMLANCLHRNSTHHNIKQGEFYVVFFRDCEFEGRIADAIGLFKTENKETFLRIHNSDRSIDIEALDGINLRKMDKGAIIMNVNKGEGYHISIIDNTNKGEDAKYWTDNFLHLKSVKDNFYNTHHALMMCKSFVKKGLPEQFEVELADQAEILNKSVAFFKAHDNFDMEEFANEVIGQPEVIESFNQYRVAYEAEHEVQIADEFVISDSAVKKQARSFKSVIKLDKNFHIYIHGDRKLIEQGEDEKGKYYKVYFKEEL